MTTKNIYFSNDGSYARLKFFVNDKPAEKEDFLKLLKGENGETFEQFIKSLSSYVTYEIQEIAMSKGRNYKMRRYIVISTNYGTYIVTSEEAEGERLEVTIGNECISIPNFVQIRLLP